MYMLQVAMETVARLKAHIHTTAWFCCLPSFSLSSNDNRGKATVILSTGDFTRTVDLVKDLTACHVFSVAGRPVAGDPVTGVKRA